MRRAPREDYESNASVPPRYRNARVQKCLRTTKALCCVAISAQWLRTR